MSSLSRREFLQMLAVASAAGINLSAWKNAEAKTGPGNPYELPSFGNCSVLHYTDCHAQLMPMYFREPSVNLGVHSMRGNAPHVVGRQFLKMYGIEEGSPEAHAFTYLNFDNMADRYGKMGGFAYLSGLVKKIRAQRPGALLLDGGDTWQGSATALWTNAQDMVGAQLLLGVDVMTAHWEMTYGAERVTQIIENDFKDKIDFVAQNIIDNQWEEPVFKPYTLREINGVPTAIVGQAFPYTPVANPRYLIPDWSFGIREGRMQESVNAARAEGAQVVILLSHNGMDVDLKMASRVTGIDAIMGGHTHDAVPVPIEVKNPGGVTLVTNAGSSGKFLGVLDLDVKKGKVAGYQYKLLPVFANMIEPDDVMAKYIDKVRAPYKAKLEKKLAVADELLYRRGNFNGTFDQLICDALMEVRGADIAFSPGFRWGASVLPGEHITFEDVMTQTAITYPNHTLAPTKGARIKDILEDVADNIFNPDPYYQQGGDMVRVGGLKYTIDPLQSIGSRISDMELNGKPLDPNKEYVVAGWASVSEPLDSAPVFDIVKEYLEGSDVLKIKELNEPRIKLPAGNPGYADS